MAEAARIYIVEDDDDIREMLLYVLSDDYDAQGFASAPELDRALSRALPDLLLLDIMLPGQTGLQILSRLRSQRRTADLYVILLTAKGSEYDRVKGLNLGADDYVSKPFSVLELVARIKAALRRLPRAGQQSPQGGAATADGVLTMGAVSVDPQRRRVVVADAPVTLTYKEFELLTCLLRHPGMVFSRDRLMREVWGFDFEGESRTVDMHIRTLRKKLGPDGDGVIQTVRGVGYKADQ
ncbi:MAG: response regulator transcription factor [Coriobacteriia bacterium]|nr:response regulator transcription factor [Coriobacteriia bacterium]